MFRIGHDGTILDFKGSEQEPPGDRIVGSKLGDVMSPEFAELVALHIPETLGNGEMQIFDYCQGIQDYEGRMVVSGANEVVVVVRNITERHETEKQRIELAIAEERTRLLQQFLETISHDLRTPLSVINTSLHLLARQTDPATQESKLALIQAQTRQLERLIEDI